MTVSQLVRGGIIVAAAAVVLSTAVAGNMQPVDHAVPVESNQTVLAGVVATDVDIELVANIAPAAPQAATTGMLALEEARRLIGTDRSDGGSSPKEGFDCSGLTDWVFNAAGVDLPRTAIKQSQLPGPQIGRDDLQAGDLVFFAGKSGRISHVGVYDAVGMMIHTSSSADEVIRASMSKMGGLRFMFGKRVD